MWDNFSLRSFSMMTRWPMRTNFKSWCSHFKSKCSWFSACFHELHSAHENCLHNTVLNSWQVLGFILWVYESQTTSWPNKKLHVNLKLANAGTRNQLFHTIYLCSVLLRFFIFSFYIAQAVLCPWICNPPAPVSVVLEDLANYLLFKKTLYFFLLKRTNHQLLSIGWTQWLREMWLL